MSIKKWNEDYHQTDNLIKSIDHIFPLSSRRLDLSAQMRASEIKFSRYYRRRESLQ